MIQHLFRPSHLHRLLADLGGSARKSLSQNFLIDGNILRKVVESADVQEGDQILEIGPGPGALTEQLLARGAHVIAIEKDPLFANSLSRLDPKGNRLDIVEGDVLDVELESLVVRDKKIKVVANLPYKITTPILIRLLPLHQHISTLTVMVQKEVALRLFATKGSSDYSALTLYLRYFAQPLSHFFVTPTCFFPAPRVHSAVVTLALKEPPDVPPEAFFRLTRTSFGKRRKMMRSSLRGLFSEEQIEEAFGSIGLSANLRPEELSYEDFLALARRFQ